jgi:hypothetical protein
MNRYSDKEIEEYLELCEFTGDCDFCKEPKGRTWCLLMAETNNADYYVSECCIDKKMDEILNIGIICSNERTN